MPIIVPVNQTKIIMTKQEKKKEQWETQLKSLSHLENYCTIDVQGLEDDSIYYHPKFVLDETCYIIGQSDTGGNRDSIYALTFTIASTEHFTTPLCESLLDNAIVGYQINKKAVLTALKTLSRIRQHINKLESYSSEYVSSILLGESLEEITKSFTEEIKTTSKIVAFMKSEINKK